MSVLASRNGIFQTSEKLQSYFCDAVAFQLVLYKPHAHIQLNLQQIFTYSITYLFIYYAESHNIRHTNTNIK